MTHCIKRRLNQSVSCIAFSITKHGYTYATGRHDTHRIREWDPDVEHSRADASENQTVLSSLGAESGYLSFSRDSPLAGLRRRLPGCRPARLYRARRSTPVIGQNY